jgi:DNA invertase Pin-like site-specific DNA recombinase
MREPRLIGYARVSSKDQNLDRQLGALQTASCGEVFTEKVSGKSVSNRPELERAICRLGYGDVLIVAEWDRAARSMLDGIALMERVHARGAAIKVLDKPHLDLTTTIGKGLLAFLSALAQDERERIHKRSEGGRKAAIARGVKMGRKSKLSDHQRALARTRRAAGESSYSIARDFGVSHTTIIRAA